MSLFSPLQMFADWLTYSAMGLKPSHAAEALNFFVFDTLKIFILLVAIIMAVSFIRSYVPPEKIRGFLIKRHPLTGNLLASLLGIMTPFCTCSAIPLFMGLLQAGVPLGTTFSFLVASPMINEVALAMLFGMFGWKIALIYALSGVTIATLSGMALGKMRLENLVENFAVKDAVKNTDGPRLSTRQRWSYAWNFTRDTVRKIWIFVLLGIAVGAWIHGFVPADFLASFASADKWYAVPLATLLGIPLYSNAAGIVPLVGALQEKGMAMGTILAFMMAVTGLSLPEFLILKKIMKTKLILIFAGTVGVGIMLTGYLFNSIL